MKYGYLRQRHPTFDPILWSEIDCLYEGGYKIMRRAGDFIKPLDGESATRFADRLRLVSYIPYMGEIVDFFLASLFESGIDVTESVDADDVGTDSKPAQQDDFWQDFAKDADKQRTPFSMVLRTAVRDALLKRRAIVAVDFPAPDAKPTSKADEKKMGVDRGYVYNVDLDTLLDWELDDEGRFKWAILYETSTERASPTQVRGMVRHCWTVWTLEDLDQVEANNTIQDVSRAFGPPKPAPEDVPSYATPKAQWQKFAVIVPPDFSDWKDDIDIPLVDEGTTNFDRIPLLQLDLPHGLWAGNKLGPMAREHWDRRSQLVGAEARNMTAIAFYSPGPGDAIPPDPADAAELRKRNVVTLPSGTVAFAEPMGLAYDTVDKQISSLKDEMFRVAHQMAMSVDTSAGAMSRSGTSKKQDKKDVAVVLGALATFTKDFAVEIYETVAQGRSEDDVVWTPRGLDKFVDDDRGELLLEGAQLALLDIPSPTFKKEYLTQLALRYAPNLPSETQDTIRKEISDGVETHQELDDLQLDNEKEAAKDTPTPGDQLKAQTDVAKVAAKAGGATKPAVGGAKKPPVANGAV